MPKISVLMSAFNCAATIDKSIDAILAQSLSDFEFLICDDGSTDGTAARIREKQKRDSRIVFLANEKNRGLPFSLNRCLAAAAGEYCARMDGDDLCDPTRFAQQAAFLDAHPEFAFVSTPMRRFDEQGYYSEGKRRVAEPQALDFVKGSPFCHAPVMVRAAAYRAVDGYRDLPRTRGVEDYDLWFRLYAAGLRGYILERPLYDMFDGRGADRRRTWRRRTNEAWVRWQGYRMLHLPARCRVYALKPLALGLLPAALYRRLHKSRIQSGAR